MGRFLRRSLSATFALGLLFVSAPPQSVAAVDPYNATAQQTLINQDRAQNGGLPALAWNNCLATIAQQNADRIAAPGSLSPTNGPTPDLGDRHRGGAPSGCRGRIRAGRLWRAAPIRGGGTGAGCRLLGGMECRPGRGGGPRIDGWGAQRFPPRRLGGPPSVRGRARHSW